MQENVNLSKTDTIIDQKSFGQRIFRKRAHYFILGPLVFLGLYLLLGFEYHVKELLEANLSRLHGADVTLQKSDFSLMTGHFSFDSIQFAHPTSPSKNLFELHSVKGHVLLSPLLRRKLIVDHLEIEGVRYMTNRDAAYVAPEEADADTPGLPLFERFSTSAYGGLKASFGRNPIRSLAQLSTGLHTQTLIEEMGNELVSTKRIQDAETQLVAFEKDLDRGAALVSDPKYFSALREKIRLLPNDNRNISSIGGLESIKKEIQRKAKETEEVRKGIQEKMQNVTTMLSNLEPEINKDVVSVQRKLGLPDEENTELTPILFGPRVLFYLERLSYWIDLSRRKMPVRTGTVGKSYVLQARNVGQNVHFPYIAGYPNFLVREVHIKSKAVSGTGTGEIDGKIKGLTSDPYIYGHPLTAEIKLSFPDFQLKNLHLKAEIDHTTDKPKETFSFEVGELPLANTLVSEGSELHLSFNKGNAHIQTHGEFNESKLFINWDVLAENVEFKVNSRYKRVEDFVKSLVATCFQLDLKGEIQGPVEDLKMTTKSEFGNHLAVGLRGEFQHQLSAIHQTVKETLQNMIHPRKHAVMERIEGHKNQELANIDRYYAQLKDLEKTASRAPNHLLSSEKD